MIKIKRANTPSLLINAPQTGNLYNKRQVVKALWGMQNGKCCYCEQSIPPEGHAKAVEHFNPKSVFKFRTNDWKNLLLACSQCNGEKSNKFPTELTNDRNNPKVIYLKRAARLPLLIDPSDPDVDPEDHIDFIVAEDKVEQSGLPKEKKNSKLGRTTIDIINLHSAHLTKIRRNYLLDVLFPTYLNLLKAVDQGNPAMIDVQKDRFKILMSARSSFAAFTRAFCRSKKLDKPPFNIPVLRGFEN